MTLEAFEAFIEEQDRILVEKKQGYTDRERVFAYTVKLGEEYGELCDEVLASVGDQRKDKLSERGSGKLEGELADVVIVAFLLAKRMGVDMKAALAAKIRTIQEKHNAQL